MKSKILALFATTIIICFSMVATNSSKEIVYHKAYILQYNEKYEIPDWVTYSITNNHRLNKIVKRANNFKKDPKVITISAYPEDYEKSGYDKGHMAPANIFRYDKVSESESFYMSNMVPQLPAVNRGIWKHIEEYTESLALYYKKIYVITGCVVFHNPKTLGENKVAIPDLLYKIIYNKNKQFIVGFLVPNINRNTFRIDSFKTSLPLIKSMSGIKDFQSIVELND